MRPLRTLHPRRPRVTTVLPLAILSASLAAAAPSPAAAQEVRGTIVQVDGSTPASGVIVLLRRLPGDTVVARTVTGERGLFILRAPGPMSARLELLRIGQRPMRADTVQLAAGETRTLRITLANTPVVMAAMNVREDDRCRVRPDPDRLVAQLFAEAQKALLASATSVSGERATARFARFVRDEDVAGRTVGVSQRWVVSGQTWRPFASIGADALARDGYVKVDRDSVVYYAPDAEVLLSDSFVATHCLQLVQGTGERAALIGIGFRPSARRRGMVDVRGTLWLDRAGLTLRSLEYGYEGLPASYARSRVGGTVQYEQLPGGLWFVSRWDIRMPRLEVVRTSDLQRLRAGATRTDTVLVGLTVSGGEVGSIHADGELRYASSTNDPAEAVTASVSSDSATHMLRCEGLPPGRRSAAIIGVVRDAKKATLTDATVRATWNESFQQVGRYTWNYRISELETTSKHAGAYALCGVPLDQGLIVTARRDRRDRLTSRPVTVRILETAPTARIDLTVPDRPPR